MRIRSIKPEWLEDQLLSGCSDTARVLSVALILLSDDYGRGRASIGFIIGHVWSVQMLANPRETVARATGALRELVAMRFVWLYEIDGQQYFAIRNWTKHQRVDKPGKPHVPEPLDDARETPAKVLDTLAPDRDRDQDLDLDQEAITPAPADDVSAVWDRFQAVRSERIPGCRSMKLDGTRRAHIRARLADYGLARCLEAIATLHDPARWWYQHDACRFELLFRSSEAFEKIEQSRPCAIAKPATDLGVATPCRPAFASVSRLRPSGGS